MSPSPNRRSVQSRTDDAGEMYEHDPADEIHEGNVVDDPIAEKQAQSQRPPRARVRPGGRPPQDHQESRAATEARQREAVDDDMKISHEYNGVTFLFDPRDFTIRFQITAERGRPAIALLGVIGEEQMDKILDWPVSELQTLTNELGKAAGLGN